MDATTRWETEAMRTGPSGRSKPPRPSAKRSTRGAHGPQGTWVTLKEAEAATGIPANTLRKWVRKEAIPSYLESDGDFALRMVDLDAIRDRASELGRALSDPDPDTDPDAVAEESSAPLQHVPASPVESAGHDAGIPASQFPEDEAEEPGPATMLVPIDAWNKMLEQLGNLHEAGQQLAEARERAAKAETEAAFLRDRLAELRDQPDEDDREATGADLEFSVSSLAPPADDPPESGPSSSDAATTTYWRYLTTGWRDRKRRERGPTD